MEISDIYEKCPGSVSFLLLMLHTSVPLQQLTLESSGVGNSNLWD